MPVVVIVGAGVIGVSWARLFAEKGWAVRLSDPRPDLPQIVDAQFAGRDVAAVADLAQAASGADFVQEAGPERLDVTVEVYRGLGKLPIALKRELPGFVGNRLQKVLNNQATYLVQQRVIEARDHRRCERRDRRTRAILAALDAIAEGTG